MKSRIFNNGGYVYVNSPLVEGWHKCADKEFFAHQIEYTGQLDDKMLKWTGKPIPKDMLLKIAAVAKCYPTTEIMVCLYYSKEEGQWLANVPKQTGVPARVDYDDEDFDPPKGYCFMGTVHTHPNMGAFWSGTDMNDMKTKPGVHVVFGLKDGVVNQVLCSLSYNGARYDQEDAIEVPEDWNTLPEPDKEWLERIQIKVPEKAPELPKFSPFKKPVIPQFRDYGDHSDSDFPDWYDLVPGIADRYDALLLDIEAEDYLTGKEM